MCGVAGYIELGGRDADPEVLREMSRKIAHRGPDGEGVWVEGGVGLAHRRLSIIDLSESGHQPMLSLDGRFVISFNGMIYNFQELRSELQALGCCFRSTSDTEVLLNVLAQWGGQGISRLNGMFAFALWDRKEKKLMLGRDRYGIKPLYYLQQDDKVAFGSEMKAILTIPGVSNDLDKEALLEYFTFQNFFTSKTLIKGVKMLPAGHYAVLDCSNKRAGLKMTRYWDFHFHEPERPRKQEEYEEELDRLFQQAVNRQLLSDVAVGSYLSGGIDSGSITGIASRHRPGMHTFTCGFDMSSASGLELSFDERAPASMMAKHFKTTHHEAELRSGDMERALYDLAYHLEEPRVGQSYPNFYAAKLASQSVKVVLSGAGGDEMFGGYPWRYFKAAGADNFDHYVDEYYKVWHRLVPNTTISKLFAPIWPDVSHVWTRDIFSDVFAVHENVLERPEDYINHSLYFEAKTFLHGLLVVEDKLSMAHGLESRVPFLDNDLVDFAMQCPVSLKLSNIQDNLRVDENNILGQQGKFIQKTAGGKQILRNMSKKYVPKKVAEAKKQGFSAPDASWFKGESIDFVKSSLLVSNARINDYMDPVIVRNLVEEHMNGVSNRRLFIWSLLNFEAFLGHFKP
ncbi:asparagine synthase (glutamine-hydrolyzing) [Terasakiella pusilla]|uniref:asparagine synthase (glutamine-hydrolyzing) n=1 Tax=Terasakiella pusilla TaxID=64973 RepID=UPI003AA9753E